MKARLAQMEAEASKLREAQVLALPACAKLFWLWLVCRPHELWVQPRQ